MESRPYETVLVTGGGGFIGTALVRWFAEQGWTAIGCGPRRPATLPEGVRWRNYDLGWASLPDDLFDGVDVLVHAAVVKQNVELNVAGSTLLLERARQRGVRYVVFLSSLAAHDGALSQYGKQKFVLEKTFERAGALVVRPGLAIGEGGIFGAMQAYVREHRFVPLIDGGVQPLQTVYVGDLVRATYAAVIERRRGVFTIAEIEPVSYRGFYRALCERLGVGVTFVPIPFWAADLAVRTAQVLRVALPIDRDNLLGLRAMRVDRRPRLDLSEGPVGDFRSSLDKIARRA